MKYMCARTIYYSWIQMFVTGYVADDDNKDIKFLPRIISQIAFISTRQVSIMEGIVWKAVIHVVFGSFGWALSIYVWEEQYTLVLYPTKYVHTSLYPLQIENSCGYDWNWCLMLCSVTLSTRIYHPIQSLN